MDWCYLGSRENCNESLLNASSPKNLKWFFWAKLQFNLEGSTQFCLLTEILCRSECFAADLEGRDDLAELKELLRTQGELIEKQQRELEALKQQIHGQQLHAEQVRDKLSI